MQPSTKPQLSERRSSIICAVVERPNHHYADDLVELFGWLQKSFCIDMMTVTSLEASAPLSGKKRLFFRVLKANHSTFLSSVIFVHFNIYNKIYKQYKNI